MPTPGNDSRYSGNYLRARGHAMARSGKKCQFCGLRRAKEGHHWAWPDYPSDEKVQGHDLTALCKPCHELATILRNWAGKGDADFNVLAGALENAANFYEKREILSSWLFPEAAEAQPSPKEETSTVEIATPKKSEYVPLKQANTRTKTIDQHRPYKTENTRSQPWAFNLFLFIILALGLSVLAWIIHVYY